MDVDAFVLAHRPTWDRLEHLVKRRRTLTGAEVDELVDLYQRVSTHLSMVRTASTDSVLVGRLSGLVARARSAVTGAHAPLWSEFARFWTVSFPVVAYRAWRWWLGTAVAFFFVAVMIAVLGGGQPRGAGDRSEPQPTSTNWSTTTSPSYYSEHPAGSFALQVWVNNSWVAAQCIGFAILLGLPDPVRAVPERRQPRGRRRADVPRRQGRHLPRPAHPARPARVDRGVPGRGGGHAAGLVGGVTR